MKKFITAMSFVIMAAIALPVQSFAYDTKNPTVETNLPKEADARAAQLLSRLEEIKAMDKESLSRADPLEALEFLQAGTLHLCSPAKWFCSADIRTCRQPRHPNQSSLQWIQKGSPLYSNHRRSCGKSYNYLRLRQRSIES